MKRIPARISWPLAIVALLLANIGIAVGTLIVANSNGGAQVVPDYYSEAIAWDSLSAIQNSSDALGWTTRVESDRAAGTISIEIVDKNGQGVDGLQGVVHITRPHRSENSITGSLVALKKQGTYYATGLNFSGTGIYDVALRANRGETIYVVRHRLDIR